MNNIVVSYPNPDTDGVACTIALSKLISLTENTDCHAVIFGKISSEAQFVLETLNLPTPIVVDSISDANRVTLVDTHHVSQLPLDFPYIKVERIIDHHPNGNPSAFPNAKIDNRQIGAAASIVTEMFFNNEYLDYSLLSLLGLAILSNTLNLVAPSTSSFDIAMYNKINDITPLSDDLKENMFTRRSDILYDDVQTMLLSDFKIFETKHGKVGISQLELYNLINHISANEIESALAQIAETKSLNFCLFNGVDIKERKSIVICANSVTSSLISNIFEIHMDQESVLFDRILLRKTDFIPRLNL